MYLYIFSEIIFMKQNYTIYTKILIIIQLYTKIIYSKIISTIYDYRKSLTWYTNIKFDAFSSTSVTSYNLLSVGFICSLRLHFRFAPYPGLASIWWLLLGYWCSSMIFRDIYYRVKRTLVHPVVYWHLATVVVYLKSAHLLFWLSENNKRNISSWFEIATRLYKE